MNHNQIPGGDPDQRPGDQNNNRNGKGTKNGQTILIFLVISLVVLLLVNFMNGILKDSTEKEITYNQFMKMLENGEVDKVVIQSSEIEITPKNQPFPGMELTYYTGVMADDNLQQKLEAAGVDYTQEIPDVTGAILYNILSLVIPLVLVWVAFGFIMRKMAGGGGVMNVGKNKAKVYSQKETGVTFKDVAGQDEAKESLQEVVDFLENPGKYTTIGAKLPKGALLVGPPGTGKTLLAKAVAGEAHVPFFSISGSDFVEMFVGVGASRVRDLFAQAKKNAPCIVFIDEIDAVGRQRGSGLGGGHDEREQTLNQLLVEMDGFSANEGIITLAATNRPDILDPALLRPGRFDRRVVVGRPDLAGREAILRVHARNKPIDPNVNFKTIAKKVPGFTGADLANLLNEAALLAARANRRVITMADLEEASEKVAYGPERKSHKVSEQEKKLTAYHESGHAIMATVLKDADDVHKVTIIPRGQAGGYTMMLPREEINFITKAQLLAQVRVALGGRCAEKIIFNEISSGASNDLQQVTNILRKMVMEWGMSDRLGPMVFGEHQEQIFLGKQLGSERNYGETVATIIDEEIHKYLDEAYKDTLRILQENIEVLHAMAKALMEVETINHEQIMNLFAYHQLNAPEPETTVQETPAETVEHSELEEH